MDTLGTQVDSTLQTLSDLELHAQQEKIEAELQRRSDHRVERTFQAVSHLTKQELAKLREKISDHLEQPSLSLASPVVPFEKVAGSPEKSVKLVQPESEFMLELAAEEAVDSDDSDLDYEVVEADEAIESFPEPEAIAPEVNAAITFEDIAPADLEAVTQLSSETVQLPEFLMQQAS